MVDIHCHIIPWVDDGADNAEIACAMAAHAYRSGIETIVATPHCNLRGALLNSRGRTYTEVFSLFRALLRQHGIPIQILPGSELYAHPSNLQQMLEEKRVITLNHSRYLLTEFHFHAPGKTMTSLLDTIAKYGYVPVVAHPERYAAVQSEPGLVAEWFAKGYIIQLNKGSLLGLLGRSAKLAGLHLLSAGLAHAIASDAHDTYYRPPGFQSLLQFLSRRCPQDYIELLLEVNPRRIIADEPIPQPQSEKITVDR